MLCASLQGGNRKARGPERGTKGAPLRFHLVPPYDEVIPMKPETPLDPSSPQEMRHPKPGVIDQRQQRIDPTNKHTVDPNDKPDDSTKQPGDPDAD